MPAQHTTTAANLTANIRRIFLLSLLLTGGGCTWTAQVSISSTGLQGNGNSVPGDITPDGRYIAFSSRANNLVANDTNARSDIFIRDGKLGTTTRVSVDSAGVEGNDDSYFPTLSDDGRYVAFWSEASNLVTNDTNNSFDVFVHDRDTGTTSRVSVDSAGNEAGSSITGSTNADISFDGRYVVFRSEAANLVANDTNNAWDIFLHDRVAGTTTRISVDSAGNQSNGASLTPTFSGDARFVTYVSAASNLVTGDTNNQGDIFVYERSSAAVSRVSVDSSGNEANGGSFRPVMDGDGRHVAFYSYASTLVADDTQLYGDIFVHDRDTGTTERVSVDSAGTQSNGNSAVPTLSADGRYVTYASFADNLVPNDTNGSEDVFLHDRLTKITSRISVDAKNGQATGDSDSSIIAGQGDNITTGRSFMLSLAYVLGMAVTYTIAGAIVGAAGGSISAALQTPIVISFVAVLFVVLSLSMFGVYELQVPSALQTRLTALGSKGQSGSFFGTAFMGAISALVVSTCVAPPLVAALMVIAQTGDIARGALALFALSIGMGIPLLVFGTSAGKLLPKAGPWMDNVKAVFGFMLLGLAVWMLDRILPSTATMALYAGLAVFAGVWFGAFRSMPDGASGLTMFTKAISILLVLYGATLGVGALSGSGNPLQPLDRLVSQVNAQVVIVIRLLSHRRLIFVQPRSDLVGIACHEAVEVIKPQIIRPVVKRSHLAGFVGWRVVVLANPRGDVTVQTHDFGECRGVFRDDARVAVIAGGDFGDIATARNVVITPGQQCRPRGSANGGRVEASKQKSLLGQLFQSLIDLRVAGINNPYGRFATCH